MITYFIIFQSKMVNGIWYYMLSSLPSEKSNYPLDRFYGLSPMGLARGSVLDYHGKYNLIALTSKHFLSDTSKYD
jgi:hypothetical protein